MISSRPPLPKREVRRPLGPVTLRFAFPDDALVLARLAALDDAPQPAHPVLLAEVSGEAVAALSLRDGRAIADPFQPSAELVELLRARAAQLRGPRSAARPWRLWRPLRPRMSQS